VRILLVEDDELLASGLITALTRANHHVDHVGDGQKAIHALADGEFDIAILDLGLPKIDGTEVLSTIRQNSVCQRCHQRSHLRFGLGSR